MMQKEELVEIYKLHAELADRVSQRREGANWLFVTLLTGLLVAIVAIVRTVDTAELAFTNIFTISGFVGMILSASWYIIIRSYRQLNKGKFKALHEIEKKLEYPFFTREWELLKEGKDYRAYWELTVVETILPATFFALSVLSLLGILYS